MEKKELEEKKGKLSEIRKNINIIIDGLDNKYNEAIKDINSIELKENTFIKENIFKDLEEMKMKEKNFRNNFISFQQSINYYNKLNELIDLLKEKNEEFSKNFLKLNNSIIHEQNWKINDVTLLGSKRKRKVEKKFDNEFLEDVNVGINNTNINSILCCDFENEESKDDIHYISEKKDFMKNISEDINIKENTKNSNIILMKKIIIKMKSLMN